MADLRSVRNEDEEEKKTEEITESLFARISEMAGPIFFRFGMYTPITGRHVCNKFGSNRIRDHRAT